MFYFPGMADALHYAGVVQASGIVTQDPIYQDWVANMQAYAAALGNTGLPTHHFWIVIKVKAEGFSENVDVHESLPMVLPIEGAGEFVGVASSKEELDEMTTPSGDPKDPRRGFIFITYKVKIQGPEPWKLLLEYLAQHNMLESET